MTRIERIGDATLYLGDCEAVMESLAGDAVDCTFTSPPYNMGLVPGGNGRGMYRPGANNKGGRFRDGYGLHDDAMQQIDYDVWQRRCLSQMFRLSRKAVFYNHRPRVEHGVLRTPLSFDFAGIPLRQIIIWDRGTGIDVNLRAYCTRQEWVLLFAKPEFALISHSASGRGDVWRIGPETVRNGHPAPFPVGLPMAAIETSGANIVLDPFMGSGSTGVACAKLGRRFVGIEIEPRHFETACQRIEAAYREPQLFPQSAAFQAELPGTA